MTSDERLQFIGALAELLRQRDALNAAITAIRSLLDEAPVVSAQSRCPNCRGTGYIAENGEYCSCQLGRDLRRVEERSKQKNEETQTV